MATATEVSQSTGTVLMVRPAHFDVNPVTAPTNQFQARDEQPTTSAVTRAAIAEFNAVVAALHARGVSVEMFEGRQTTPLPDEVFPNNWFTTHADGTLVLYPLCAWNRREERRRDIVDELQRRTSGYRIDKVIDLSVLEEHGHFLEGTGSLVLDRPGRIVYACKSPRTHAAALHVFTKRLGFHPVYFDARDLGGQAIYHTNVMMSVGTGFAVVCLEAIQEVQERFRVLRRLESSGREVIEISLQQMHRFAANLLELETDTGRLIVLSKAAAATLSDKQSEALARHGDLVPVNVQTIEKYGGGSVRCMLAEIFLPRK